MNTYQILIEYEGTNFVGWQIQKNGLSVQEVIQKSLKRLTKKNIIIFGSGRTDAGVHAIEQSAHFKTNYKIKNKINFIKSLNFFLSKYDVSILDIKKKSKQFHARYSAKKRTYKYLILNRQSPSALEKHRAWNIRKKLNLKIIKKGANLLRGTKDFSTFRSSSCNANSPIKTILDVKIRKFNKKIEIKFVAKSFLQQQVRSMVGCLKYLGEGKWDLKRFKKAIILKKRSLCAPPAPSCGLYLLKIKY
tara:strand:- start:1489 stop:2229 length:741 start_codon:yes stop_codon:yes gene_type:complete